MGTSVAGPDPAGLVRGIRSGEMPLRPAYGWPGAWGASEPASLSVITPAV